MIVHDALAELFAYPGSGGRERILDALRSFGPELRKALAPFAKFVEETEATELEESFTRTFDINPVCTLEIGWHLYGEDYSRGAFLVSMRERMRALGIEETSELPDHITSVLAVLGRLEGAEADEFARGQVVPAINRMLDGFKIESHPYRVPVVSVRDWLRERHGAEAEAPADMVPAPYEGICGTCGKAPQEENTDE